MSLLRHEIDQALDPLTKDAPSETEDDVRQQLNTPVRSHGFDSNLLQMDGWTPDPGSLILPVDGKKHALTRQILLMDLHNIVLLKAMKSIRSVGWDKVMLVHLFDGVVTFEITDEPPLAVAGYKHPEEVLKRVQECHKAATERILQGLATRVIRPTP